MKKSGYSGKILAILCAAAMVITMLPAGLISDGVTYAVDQPAAESAKPESSESTTDAVKTDPEQEETGQETVKTEPEAKTEETSGNKPDEAVPDAKSDSQAADNTGESSDEKTDPKSEGKKEDKEEKAKVFKAEFDFGNNYANFSPINPRNTDENGRIKLPVKPEARKEVYKARDGKEYYFTGWKYKDKEYEPGDEIMLKADAEFYAVWKQTYTISFSTKGIEADEVESQTEVYGEPVVLPDETASQDGYDFIGWTPDNGKTVYKAGAEIKANSIQPKRSSGGIRLTGVTEDNTPPMIFIGITSKTGTNATLNMYASDVGSGEAGVDTLAYVVSDADVTDYSGLTGWTAVANNASNRSTVVVDDGKYLIVRAVDKSGNTGYEKRHVDCTNMRPDEENIKVQITDVNPAATTMSKSHTISFETSHGVEAIVMIQVLVDSNIYSTLDPTAISVDLALTDGDHTIQLFAVGEWGSLVGTDSIVCKYDSTEPAVTVAMAETKEYYSKDNCGIKVTAADEEGGSGIDSIVVKTTVGGEEKTLGSASGETAASGILELSAETVAGVLGEIEQELTITATAKDKAGNEKTATLDIKYDNVAPKLISVQTSKAADAQSDDYYYHGEATSTTYTIEETNPSDISLTYKKDGTAGSGTADSSKKAVTGSWNSQGTYSDIKLSAVDKAGNKLVLDSNYTHAAEDTASGPAVDGVISFSYGKIIDTTKPTATVYYDTGTSPVTQAKAKIHLYKESNKINAYVSGSVKAKKIRIQDNKLYPTRIYLQTNDGIKSVQEAGLEIKTEGNYEYVELEDVNIITQDGEDSYHIYGTDRVNHALQVTEYCEDGVDVVTHGDARWPTTATAVKTDTGLQVNFIRDTATPVYTSSFTQVEDVAENVAEDTSSSGEYVGYYGNTEKVEGMISAGFEIVESNYDADQTWAKVVYKTGDDYSAVTPAETDSPEVLQFESKGSDKYVCQKEVSGTDANGVYRFYVYGVDKAGNPLRMSSAEETKAAVTGTAGYNKTISCGSDEPGKFRSFSKVLDTEAPGYGLKISDADLEGYLVKYGNVEEAKQDLGEDGTYKPFRKNKKATVLAKGYDPSPVKLEYKFKYIDASSEEPTWIDSDVYSSSGYPENKTLTEEKEGETQFRVKDLKVTDRAGNSIALGESNTVYLDGTSPVGKEDIIKPEVKITSATKAVTHRDTGYDLYNTDVDLKFTITDPNEHKSSSGLQHIWYTISVDGKEIAKERLIKPNDDKYFDKGDLLCLTKSDVEDDVKEKGDEALTYTMNRTITIPKGVANGYESNDIVVTLYAVDNSDNEAEPAVKGLGIDSVAPEIYITVSGKSARGNKYFKADRTAIVKVIDRNLGEKSNTIKIATQIKVPDSWTYKAGADISGNKDEWIKKLLYNKDGDYTLAVSGTDALGNRVSSAKIHWEGEHPKAFTIDKTAPKIKVTFDNNNVRNGKYYKANRTATISIVEHNFYDPDVKVSGKAQAPRKRGMSFPGRSKFSSKGDNRKATIAFNKEGNFSFDVNYTDLAGNPAKAVKIPEFVIDKTPPVVKIENVDANGIYSGAIAPRASFEDDNFDRNNSRLVFTGAKGGDRSDLAGAMKEHAYGGVYTMRDFPRIRDNDDIYTASATSTDMAGNTTTVTVSFSVNRFGSTYDYDGDAKTIDLVGKKAGRYYTNTPQALVIREINVNPLKKYALTLYKDDTSRKLEKGKDYKVEERTGNGGYQYIYRINKDVIQDEGSYNIVVTSEDEADNINTNASVRSEEGVSEVPLKFVYDTTAPTVSFLNIADDSKTIDMKEKGKTLFRGMRELDLGVRPDDDWALSAIEIGIRSSNSRKGQLFGPTKYEGEEFWEFMGADKQQYFEEIIRSGSDTKYIDITVWDAAGNEYHNTYEVLVTANIFELMLHYWYITLAILVAIAAGIYFYIRRKRDQEEEYAE